MRHVKLTILLSAALLIMVVAVMLRLPTYDVPSEGKEDIYFIWTEAKNLSDGINPYSRILSGDWYHNEKYPTHLPLMYILAAIPIVAGVSDYPAWHVGYQTIELIFELAFGLVLLWLGMQKKRPILGLWLMAIWLMHSSIFYVTRIGQLDNIIIMSLLLSLYWVESRPRTSAIILGVSLAIKQFGILLVPICILAIAGRKKRLSYALLAGGIVAAVCFPFFLAEPCGFLKSILFSATRLGSSHLEPVFGNHGLFVRLPVMLAWLGVLWMVYRRQLPPFAAGFLIYTAFVGLNPVVFPQYKAYPLGFGLFAMLELCDLFDRARQAPAPAPPESPAPLITP